MAAAKKTVGTVKGKAVVEGKDGKLHYGKGTKGGTALAPVKSKVAVDKVKVEKVRKPKKSAIIEDEFDELDDDFDIDEVLDDAEVRLPVVAEDEAKVYITADGLVYPSAEVDILTTSGFTSDQLFQIAQAGSEEREALAKEFAKKADRYGYSKHYFTVDGDYGDYDHLRIFDSREEADEALDLEDEQVDRGWSYY